MQQQKNTVSDSAENSPAGNSFKESSILTLMKDHGQITFAAAIAAVTVNFFFTSTGLTPGGVTSLSLVCSTIFGVPVSTMSLCISVPLLILSTVVLEKSFGIKTLYTTLVTPLFMKLVPPIRIAQFLLDIHPLLELAVAGLLEGLLIGATVSIALNHACAIGGTDVIAPLIQCVFKLLKISVILFLLDGFAVITSSVITQNVLISIFSFLSLTVVVQTTDSMAKHKLSAWTTAS